MGKNQGAGCCFRSNLWDQQPPPTGSTHRFGYHKLQKNPLPPYTSHSSQSRVARSGRVILQVASSLPSTLCPLKLNLVVGRSRSITLQKMTSSLSRELLEEIDFASSYMEERLAQLEHHICRGTWNSETINDLRELRTYSERNVFILKSLVAQRRKTSNIAQRRIQHHIDTESLVEDREVALTCLPCKLLWTKAALLEMLLNLISLSSFATQRALHSTSLYELSPGIGELRSYTFGDLQDPARVASLNKTLQTFVENQFAGYQINLASGSTDTCQTLRELYSMISTAPLRLLSSYDYLTDIL